MLTCYRELLVTEGIKILWTLCFVYKLMFNVILSLNLFNCDKSTTLHNSMSSVDQARHTQIADCS